jgi:ribosomal protein S18 acetylase RimI-like enzyme
VETRTLTWRPLTPADAAALTRSWAAVEAVDGTGEHLAKQNISEALEDDSVDLSRDSLAAFAPDGEAVAFAWLQGTAEVRDLDRIDIEGAVLPAARRSGLGRRLLDWAEERGASMHRERHPGTAGVLCVAAHENNAGKAVLLRAAGFEATRWAYTMTSAMDPLPEPPPLPSAMSLALYSTEWDEAVRQAHREAFAEEWGSTPPDERAWLRWYTGSDTFRPDVSWLVLGGDEVAAYLLTYFWEADAAATGVREAFVGQLGVRPAFRRRGLGRLLLARALRSYRDAGYERSALNVDTANPSGALGLYERAGYEVGDTWVTWTKPLD